MKIMKHVLAITLSVVLVGCLMGPTTVYAEECEHNFDRGFESGNESDICTKCGAIRPGIDAPYELPFITREDTVVARKEPRQSSDVVNTYELGTRIKVVARLRNEHDNMWLKLSDGSYMFSDRAAFDFDSMASFAMDSVYRPVPMVCYPTISFWNGLGLQCSPTLEGTLASMLVHFKPKGTFDLKLRNRLGANSYDYYVYADGMFQDERYTGEDLGNILYGYACKDVGIPLNDAIRFAGLTETSSLPDTAACLFLNDLPRCDKPNDIEMIILGWNDFNYGYVGGAIAGGGGGGGGF
ncbi:MAG: hypothetical protein K2K56_10610 [Lachnospiraceae bacterium]|nr:hypothetical protein [Lachnospiraceae bacterium]